MTAKWNLKVAKRLNNVFKDRTFDSQSSGLPIEIIPSKNHQDILIFDTTTSKKILTSKAFVSLNSFKQGSEYLKRSEEPVALLPDFFNSTILFKEGPEHRHTKRNFHSQLEVLSTELLSAKPLIFNYISKRKHNITNPLVFSNMLVRLFVGLMVSHLTSIPLKRVFHALSIRRNIFFSYLSPSPYIATNNAFKHLYASSSPPLKNTTAYNSHLLAQSLIVMGIDPMIGTICASLVENNKSQFKNNVNRHCPTSFVSRICMQHISIAGVDFNPGDICYISLLPSTEENMNACPSNIDSTTSLAFGAGIHTCIGKNLSLVMLDIAEEIAQAYFNEGFKELPSIKLDGTFLCFKAT